jgi:hypothetical protein
MNARELTAIINHIKGDHEHLQQRRIFNENWEWLEHFWRYEYWQRNNSFDDFIAAKGHFYWNIEDIKGMAICFASIECVGSNYKPDYSQNQEIANATMYLRYSCNLFEGSQPNCDSIGCRGHKTGTELCNRQAARNWRGDFDSVFAFKALMYILRQIRNNLFHGHKLSMEQPQYGRNVELVGLAANTTDILIERLIESEGFRDD